MEGNTDNKQGRLKLVQFVLKGYPAVSIKGDRKNQSEIMESNKLRLLQAVITSGVWVGNGTEFWGLGSSKCWTSAVV